MKSKMVNFVFMESTLYDLILEYTEISEEEAAAMADLQKIREYKKGDIILKEGAITKESYYVIKGCLRSYYVVDGEEKTTEFYTKTQSAHPQCAADNKPSKYYIECIEDSTISVSSTEVEEAFFEKYPRLEKYCRIISEKMLGEKQSSFDTYKLLTPEQRYLHMLETRPELLQRVPQYLIASYLGLTPQSLSRMRNRIVKKD